MSSYVFPVSGDYKISSFFGLRNIGLAGATTNHQGIDIAVPSGTAVLSAFSGTVSKSGFDNTRGYYMEVDSGNGLTSVYQHLSGFVAKLGQSVAAGQKIANSGNTGLSTGSHLHFSILQDGKAVDPLKYTGSGSTDSLGDLIDTEQLTETIKKYWWAIAIGLVGLALIKK
mgnify:CR=1 FL=1